MIAATARAHALAVATRNEDHLRQFNVAVLNPFEARPWRKSCEAWLTLGFEGVRLQVRRSEPFYSCHYERASALFLRFLQEPALS